MIENAAATGQEHSGHVAVVRLPHSEPKRLNACSICLRVRVDEHWIEAATAIRALRSFEHADIPRLLPAICDRCAALLALRRARHGLADAA